MAPVIEAPRQSDSAFAIPHQTKQRYRRMCGINEVSILEDGTERLLRRGEGYARRAAEYRPSLSYFSSTTFSDFIRHTILGVPSSDDVRLPPAAAVSGSRNLDDVLPIDRAPNQNQRRCSNATSLAKENDSPKNLLWNEEEEATATTAPESPTSPFPRDERDAVVFDIEVAPILSRNGKRRGGELKQPCKKHLADGMAKVTPPEGWWDKKGIAGDVTARGPDWAAGTELGDMLITNPIKQCVSGIGGAYDFTMIETPSATLSKFRETADRYRKRQIGSAHDDDTSDEFIDGLTRKFWRRLGPTMEPSTYGADVDGTLFQGAEACGWNIDKLDSCLKLLTVDAEDGDGDGDGEGEDVTGLPGVTSAYLYFGMWSSVFAAHTEDMNLLSINYLHAGAPKYWYAISPEDSQRFESLATSHFGPAASLCPDFLRHKRYLLSPIMLKKAGISYTTLIQRPGDAIVTFPGSYHFGFNTGFNIAESSNFAVPEWVPIGRMAEICMCHPHSVRIDMNRFEFLLRQYDEDSRENDDGHMTYMEWAKREAKRRREKTFENSTSTSSPQSPADKATYKKGVVVEVLTPVPRRKYSSSPESKKRSSPKKRKANTYRIGLKVRPATFTRNTHVLCQLVCEDGKQHSDDKNEAFFAGTITEVVDDYVRVHFHGMTKKEDVWMLRDSMKLLLDGGPEKSSEEKEKVGGGSLPKSRRKVRR